LGVGLDIRKCGRGSVGGGVSVCRS
jgi:hypothetical protein